MAVRIMSHRKLIIFVLLLVLFSRTHTHFDLFMNETETKRILGIPGSLFYVRNGVINDYALSFNLPIKSNVDEIYFSWQNMLGHSSDIRILYGLAIHVSNAVVMGHPVASIPLEGVLPHKPSVFSILLRCSGLLVAEVDIRIQLNITVFPANNVTILEIKRKKTCVKGHSSHLQSGDAPSLDEELDFFSIQNVSRFFPVPDQATSLFGSGGVFYIVVGSASGAIFLLAFALVVFYCRSQKSNRDGICDTVVSRAFREQENGFIVRSDTPTSNSLVSGGTYRGLTTFPYMELRPRDVESLLGELQVSRLLVKLSDALQDGTFGRVHRGTLTTRHCDGLCQRHVLIKTVTDDAETEQVEEMLKDGCLTRGVNHENVATVIAAVLDFPPLLIYSDCSKENLKQFLHHCRSTEALLARQLVYMAAQIARGLCHLHRKRILHRDISTRNCLVDDQLSVSICDSSLSRDIFPSDYERQSNGSRLLPVRWMAVESLSLGKYSTASDVWSFGVTMWELFTFAHRPYPDFDPYELVGYLMDGFRLIQPINCPNEIFTLMSLSWMLTPEDRPRPTQLQASLQDFYGTLARFI